VAAKIPKKRGRPATGHDPMVRVRVPKSMLDRIDRWSGRFEAMDRSAALRSLLNLGLNRSRGKPATVYDPKGFKAHHAKRKSDGPKVFPPQPSEAAERRKGLMLVKGALS
jgi:hypothetical protein